ncbi:hypothetical protein PoB_006014600 [Plakobranchus ocellatus]|uniref:Uncharacterized protein n=1 Tax=Plakobranchus ocellatus TaxID=259542 RepID=A0AAV4CP31_9GAST|nr:hypothetical protein PoB_006014600 [Plakobranchus ocellatus]
MGRYRVGGTVDSVSGLSSVKGLIPTTGALAWRRARKPEIILLWTGYIQKPNLSYNFINHNNINNSSSSYNNNNNNNMLLQGRGLCRRHGDIKCWHLNCVDEFTYLPSKECQNIDL